MRCVLIFDTATAATYVQIVRGETTVYSQLALDPDDAAAAAEDLWNTLAENATAHFQWAKDHLQRPDTSAKRSQS
jgi:hypothetical protein